MPKIGKKIVGNKYNKKPKSSFRLIFELEGIYLHLNLHFLKIQTKKYIAHKKSTTENEALVFAGNNDIL
jgi:hypothetical protein